ncbi:signal transduction histidine kinase [Arthrobacter sp. CAN_A214]|uniref:ATP-binding protein n=1 Tax=Arthrobacter sp. CAN_A214 TaxID=2787720 RepID=UPI0018CA4705
MTEKTQPLPLVDAGLPYRQGAPPAAPPFRPPVPPPLTRTTPSFPPQASTTQSDGSPSAAPQSHAPQPAALQPPAAQSPAAQSPAPHIPVSPRSSAPGSESAGDGPRRGIGRSILRLAGQWTVRSRVLGAVLVLSTLGLLVAGTAAYALERANLDAEMDGSLSRSFGELETLLDTGIDPDTGTGFVEAEQLVYLVMQRTLPAPNEGMMGVRDGQAILLANESVNVRLENDPELVSAVAGEADSPTVRISTFTTSSATYRAVTVPVQLGQDPQPTVFVLAFDTQAERSQLDQTFGTFALISLGTLLLIGVVGWLLVGNLLQPVRRLRDTARQISDSDLSQRIAVTGNDDLSDLTRTINAMLDRLEGSFTSQRQLFDDVGHELRTPITIVQGHLELQDSSDRADVDAVRGVALDELGRMRFLVDDLVTLAGSSRPDFVRAESSDIGRLTDEVLDKVRGLGPRRWAVDSRAEGFFRIDERRITQAWLQLAANAVKFSAEGSTVTLGSRLEPEGLRLWLRDEGVGIPKADQQRIFERFTRGANSKRAEGSGLGLTIVDAIVRAHGGTVELESAPGSGSTFTLSFPHTPVAAQPKEDA